MLYIGTDGLCKNNQAQGPQKGSWAFVVMGADKKILGHKKGTSDATTNNEMELVAIVEALKWCKKFNIKAVEILSDSSYCVKGLTEWLDGWKSRGWKTAAGAPVKNKELFQTASGLLHPGVKLTWVKGHAGHQLNELADMYCNEVFLNTFM